MPIFLLAKVNKFAGTLSSWGSDVAPAGRQKRNRRTRDPEYSRADTP